MQDDLKDRTKRFAVRVIRLCEALPKGRTTDVIGGQLLRCGTSVGANYRAACRARSPAEFIAKVGIVEEECDESLFWMELMIEAGLVPEERLSDLMREADSAFYFAQFSILRFGTRLNSFSLFVTTMQPIERTCAAISISREPMGVPCFSKKARSLPYCCAASSPYDDISRGAKNWAKAN